MAPHVRLAYFELPMVDEALMDKRDPSDQPSLLVSYVFLRQFLKVRDGFQYRDWVLDSGAFSAHNSGAEIKLQDYIDTCKRLQDGPDPPVEVFALDVIGDWRATLKNTEQMTRHGIDAIPTYHYGQPEHVLKKIAKDYPKIALGGAVGLKSQVKMRWAAQCFARVWPKKIHGFGFGSERAVLGLPWHSTDASSWECGPCRFGRWASYGNMSVRGSNQNLRVEVEWYLRLERKARHRWKKEMALLEAEGTPDVRLAVQPTSVNRYECLRSGK